MVHVIKLENATKDKFQDAQYELFLLSFFIEKKRYKTYKSEQGVDHITNMYKSTYRTTIHQASTKRQLANNVKLKLLSNPIR